MKPIALLAISSALMTSPIASFAADLSAFEYQAEILRSAPNEELVKFRLSADVLSRINEDRLDLRVVDDTDREIPFGYFSDRGTPHSGVITHTLISESYESSDNEEVFTFRLSDRVATIDSITISTPAKNFKRSVRIQGSLDGTSWQDLGRDTIFDFSAKVDLRRTDLKFPATEVKLVRLSLDTLPPHDQEEVMLRYNGLEFSSKQIQVEPLKISSVTASSPSKDQLPPEYSSAEFQPQVVENTKLKRSEIQIPIDGLPLERLAILTDDRLFQRPVRVWCGSPPLKGVHMPLCSTTIIRFPEMPPTDTVFSCSPAKSNGCVIGIDNGDSSPLRVQSVQISWLPRVVYFLAEPSKRYRIVLGSKRSSSPQYDLPNLITPSSPRVQIAPLSEVGKIERNPKFDHRSINTESFSETTQRWSFIAIVTLIGSGIAVWIYRLAKQLPEKR